MKKFLLCFLFLALLAVWLPVRGAQAQQADPEGTGLDALCLVDAYAPGQADCTLAGPAAVRASLEAHGYSYPQPLLIYQQVPASLAQVPYHYALLDKGAVPVFSMLPTERKDNPTTYLGAGFKYISYHDDQSTPVGRFFLSDIGYWIDGSYISRVTPSVFQGVTFPSTPAIDFGWVMTETSSYSSPGGKATPNNYQRFDFVTVYQVQTVNGVPWVQIGPNAWLEKSLVASVEVNTTPPEGVSGGRWIEVNLYDQTLSVYDNYQLVFATLISSGGAPFYTRPGTFQIYEKLDSTTMSGSFEADKSDFYYLEDVPWTMYYDQSRALHGAYWHSFFGYAHSHGCVNLSLSDAHWLYDWASVGDWVYVWDPSGNTPTDPSFYTNGGAP
jgi:lipoprotein-anchoring transpeptidase ErfK/SrfK